MSSESRILRPFEVDERLAGALQRATFSYGSLRCGADGRILVEDASFGMRTAVIEWSPEVEFDDFKRDLAVGAEDTGIDKSLLCLAVTARSGYLKTCDLVWCHSLDDLSGLDRLVPISGSRQGARWRAFCAETHGAVVDAYVARRHAAETPSPRRPSRKGAWLAHVSFRIERESDSELFRPQPLDDKTRSELRLPAKVMRFVDFDGAKDVTTSLSEGDVPTFWVDDRLLSDLDARATSPVAQHVQRQLVIDFVSAVVFEFSSLPQEEASGLYEEIKDSLIGRVVRFLSAGGTDAECERILRECKNNPRWAIARAEDAIDVRAAARKSLEQ